MNHSIVSLYCVWDDQFSLYSDPFLAADDKAAERLLVQAANVSDEFRKRLCFQSLYCIGTYYHNLKCPARMLKRPRYVSGSERLIGLVDAIEKAQKAHLATVFISDSEVKEDTSDEKPHSEILQCFDPT